MDNVSSQVVPSAGEPITPNAVNTEGLSFNDNDFAADIAKLANASGMTVSPPVEPIQLNQEPVTPAQPERAAVTETEPVKNEKTEVPVPDKFKTADGQVDVEKLAKSADNVEQALAKYLAKEKELKQKINEVKRLENPYLNTPTIQAPQVQQPAPSVDFATQIEQDLATQGAGKVLAKLTTALQQSVEEKVQERIRAIENYNADIETKRQIEAIGKNDPWVYTEDGINTLNRILSEQPYLLQAPDPYKAAYLQYSGMKNVSVPKSVPQVSTPTPTARPSAPVPTGQAANQTITPSVNFATMDNATLQNHLKGLTPAQQSEFFKKAGFPGF